MGWNGLALSNHSIVNPWYYLKKSSVISLSECGNYLLAVGTDLVPRNCFGRVCVKDVTTLIINKRDK